MKTRRLVCLVLVFCLGLASRRWPIGWVAWDKLLGDACYAGAVYLVIGLAVPRLSGATLGFVAFAICLGIELFQLTGIPLHYRHIPPVRWLLGTTFGWIDIAAYAVGCAVPVLIDASAQKGAPEAGDAHEALT